jgi:hypothetical protein
MFTGPNIITDGLVLSLDAGNNKSYQSGSTTWFDRSGRGNNGTLTNGPTFNSANGGSIVFDGVNDYVSMGNFIQNITAFTVNHWITLNISQTTRTIFSNYSTVGGPRGWVTGISDSTANVVKFFLGDSTLFSTFALIVGIPYYVTVTYNSGNPTIYINGVFNNSSTTTITYSSLALNNDIGRLGTGIQNFNGRISQVSVYNRALTPDEILQNYNATKTRFGL